MSRGRKKYDTRAEIDLARVLPRSVPVTEEIAHNLRITRRRARALGRLMMELEELLKGAESASDLLDFEIQGLISTYNRAAQLASSIEKKKNDVADCILKALAG